MGLVVYDTLRNETVPFEPTDGEGDEATMYVCGITPQDQIHVGHLRTYVAYDVLRRWLEAKGYDVTHVQNVTDVDDKLIDRAEGKDVGPTELAAENHRQAEEEMAALRCLPADHWPRVSESVDGIIEMTETLLDRGHAYVSDEAEGIDHSHSVYYDVSTFDDYGKLSGHDPDEAEEEADEEDMPPGKRDPRDFALWKASKPGEPQWDSPWGKGRPGWHIECSVMSSSILGPRFDIHGGGRDLVFPHHENEIAQTEGASGEAPTVRYWMHTGFLTVDGEKMSKSLGNFITAEEALDDWDPVVLRLWLVGTHYRSPIDFSEESLEQARKNLDRIENTLTRVETALEDARGTIAPDRDRLFLEDVREQEDRFAAAMDDDLNTPEALAALVETASLLNKYAQDDPHGAVLRRARGAFADMGQVLAVLPDRGAGGAGEADPYVDLLVDLREELRDKKEFDLADRIRDELDELGVTVEDTDDGARWFVE
jgi:cysteinyl-tRNA synthetase